jgi:hypothetical protein
MTRSNFIFAALVAGLTACDSAAPGGGGQVSFNVATTTQGAAPSRPVAAPDTLLDAGGNVLVLTRVEIVLRDIELKRQNHSSCDSLTAGDDDCEEFEAGPVLIDLPLNGGVNHEFTIAVDSGTFDELELKVHKPEDDGDARDQAFLAAHPDLSDVSIRVTGTFNGTAFTYTTDLGADQEFSINPPLVVGSQTDVAVTLNVDVSGWFLSGATLVNPALALKGGAFESVVENNIEASFEAFHDDDRDGHDDD